MNKLFVVGIGPGRAEEMTLRAARALEASEVIAGYGVYADLVKPLFPDKEYLVTPMRREAERCRMAIEAAISGRTTAIISSGDAGVYGMAGLAYELAADADIDIEIVPGVTAALSGAAGALLVLLSGFFLRAFPILAGCLMILSSAAGLYQMMNSIYTPWYSKALSVLVLLLGILILIHPGAIANAIVFCIGAAFMVNGISGLIMIRRI